MSDPKPRYDPEILKSVSDAAAKRLLAVAAAIKPAVEKVLDR